MEIIGANKNSKRQLETNYVFSNNNKITLAFLHTSNNYLENVVGKVIPFTVASKIKKFLDIKSVENKLDLFF